MWMKRELGIDEPKPTLAPCPECGRAADDIELDATDFAHPAWWRGHDHAAIRMSEQLADALGLDKRDAGDWQLMLAMVRALRVKGG